MIVVEGLDATGKTTLVQAIKAEFPILQVRDSIGNKHDLKQIKRQAHDESVHHHTTRHQLTDRSRLISEYIYHSAMRDREFAYSLEDWLYMLAGFVQGHHLIVYCQRPMNEIVEGWDEQEQLSGVYENLFIIDSYYDKTMAMISHLFDIAQSGSHITLYEFHLGTGHVMSQVEQYLKEVE